MAKLTLQFKGKPIDVFLLEADRATLGREPDNQIVIDSLAIAPCHIAFTRAGDGYDLSVETEQFPVFLNDQKIQNGTLKHGDLIKLGKHTLLFSDEVTTSLNLLPDALSLAAAHEETSPETETSEDISENTFPDSIPPANLQFMNGPDIGRLIPLGRRVTELSLRDLTPAIVARRSQGYIVCRLLDDVSITIGGEEIGPDAPIQDGDMLCLDNQKLQFFIDPL